MARLWAARGVAQLEDLDLSAQRLLPPSTLRGSENAAQLLGQAVLRQQSVAIVADYDCDGATACAVAIRGLRMMGAKQVFFEVPDRRLDGYGLTPSIARRVHERGAEILVTVDNGIASVQGVQAAQTLGMRVLITDHHLPGDELPAADALVNPNQPGCSFASKHLAGVGVMFYVLLATRAWLRERGHWPAGGEPRLDTLLPLVALGTVADVVTLDANNRRLVHLGLERIRRGQMPAGMRALFDVSAKPHQWVSSQDLGFSLGPRINAAGRLAHMGLGIDCLLTEDATQALACARTLDDINRQRRTLEDNMREQALATLEQTEIDTEASSALCLYDDRFHEGIIGILAGRLKDQHHRPTFVFAPAHGQGDLLKGSGRSIPGFHLRDALDAISKQHPECMTQFGGHAMAAGCTLHLSHWAEFERAFQHLALEWIDPHDLRRIWVTDGDLTADELNLQHTLELELHIWGAGFPAPLFCSEWQVLGQRLLGEKHLKLNLARPGQQVDAIWFGRNETLGASARLLYRPQVNRWQGRETLQLMIEGQV
ncbi:MAG: single-stranded-DNA-specific exonuclease RecJ [Alphaproteobacteria bacterium]|nr:single-stranded-DNA-specific exonuclease RecJ [Alphaproteobacteria bacterium]